MTQAIDAYRSLAASPEFQEMERVRSKARHDEAQALSNAEERGWQRGQEEKTLDFARKLMEKGIAIDEIAELTALTHEEIERLRS